MRTPAISLLFVVAAAGMSNAASAQQVYATLKVTENSAGEVVAHATGFLNLCGYSGPPLAFSVSDHTLTVVQGFFSSALLCVVDPYGPYDVSVDFGRLPKGTYNVEWNLPDNGIDLTATYTVSNDPGFQIGPGVTGSWYDPAQSGHGFDLQVLSTQPPQLLATWYVFDAQGKPLWITGVGPISGNEAVVQGMTMWGPGALFPPLFDATQVYPVAWGTLTFKFSDCNNGTVSWHANDGSLHDGELALARLTLPAGLSCP